MTFPHAETADAYRFLAERGVNAPAGSFYAIEPSRRLGLGDAGGLRTDVLSPLETLSKKERADKADYFTLMDANLEKIATALGCPPRS